MSCSLRVREGSSCRCSTSETGWTRSPASTARPPRWPLADLLPMSRRGVAASATAAPGRSHPHHAGRPAPLAGADPDLLLHIGEWVTAITARTARRPPSVLEEDLGDAMPVTYASQQFRPGRTRTFIAHTFGWQAQPFAAPDYFVAPHGDGPGVDTGLDVRPGRSAPHDRGDRRRPAESTMDKGSRHRGRRAVPAPASAAARLWTPPASSGRPARDHLVRLTGQALRSMLNGRRPPARARPAGLRASFISKSWPDPPAVHPPERSAGAVRYQDLPAAVDLERERVRAEPDRDAVLGARRPAAPVRRSATAPAALALPGPSGYRACQLAEEVMPTWTWS